MDTKYEHLESKTRVPVEMNLQSIGEQPVHRHKQLEMIFVLEGAINLHVQEKIYRLEENDLILINSYELHGIFGNPANNSILTFQIDTSYYDFYTPSFSDKQFLCNTTLVDRELALSKEGPFEEIRKQLATLAQQWHSKQTGYQFSMAIAVLSLGKTLMTHFESEVELKKVRGKDVQRLIRILDYIDSNFEKGVNLKEIAEMEGLNFYYLSSFIKQNLGLSFQDYVNIKRIEKVVDQLVMTKKNVTDIAFESGFSTTKSLNQLFKKTLKMTPTEFRGKYSGRREAVANLDSLLEVRGKEQPLHYESVLKKIYSHL